MTLSYRVAESASEALYEDERLRSNLTDSEANVVLTWATDWLTEQVNAASDATKAQQIAQREAARVRAALSAFNALGKQGTSLNLAEALAAVAPVLESDPPFTREEIFTLLTALTSAAWQLHKT